GRFLEAGGPRRRGGVLALKKAGPPAVSSPLRRGRSPDCDRRISLRRINQPNANLASVGCPRLFSFPQPRGLSGGGPCGHAVRNQLRELLRRAVERFEA